MVNSFTVIRVATGVSVSAAFLPVVTYSYTDQLEICTLFGRCCPSRPAYSGPASPGCVASLTVAEPWTALDIAASWCSTSVTTRRLSVRTEGHTVGTIKKSTGTWCSEVWGLPDYQPKRHYIPEDRNQKPLFIPSLFNYIFNRRRPVVIHWLKVVKEKYTTQLHVI